MNTQPISLPATETDGPDAAAIAAAEVEAYMMKADLRTVYGPGDFGGASGGPNGSFGMIVDFVSNPVGTFLKVLKSGKGW